MCTAETGGEREPWPRIQSWFARWIALIPSFVGEICLDIREVEVVIAPIYDNCMYIIAVEIMDSESI